MGFIRRVHRSISGSRGVAVDQLEYIACVWAPSSITISIHNEQGCADAAAIVIQDMEVAIHPIYENCNTGCGDVTIILFFF